MWLNFVETHTHTFIGHGLPRPCILAPDPSITHFCKLLVPALANLSLFHISPAFIFTEDWILILPFTDIRYQLLTIGISQTDLAKLLFSCVYLSDIFFSLQRAKVSSPHFQVASVPLGFVAPWNRQVLLSFSLKGCKMNQGSVQILG